MRLLIMGGSGQLSGRLAAMAVEQGHEVFALTRGSRALCAGVTPLIADRNDEQAVRSAVRGLAFDAVLDCICMNARHARIDLDVLSGCTERFVVVSTDSVYHPLYKRVPQNEQAQAYLRDGSYGAQKREMEEVFLASGAAFTLLRPGHIFGPGFLPGCFPEHSRQRELLAHIREGRPLRLVGGGALLIHPVFVDDLAQVMLDVIPNPRTFGRVFCIGGPECVPNRRYYEILGALLSQPVTVEEIPMEGYLEQHPEYSGHLCQRCYDLSALENAGVALPRTTLAQGLALQLQRLMEEEEHP